MLRRSSASAVAVTGQPAQINIPQQASAPAPVAAPTAEAVSLQAELAIQQALALAHGGARIRLLCGGMDVTATLRRVAGTDQPVDIALGIDRPGVKHHTMHLKVYVVSTGACSFFTGVFSTRPNGQGAHITADFCDHNAVRRANLTAAPLVG
jgi:hypothetical protein